MNKKSFVNFFYLDLKIIWCWFQIFLSLCGQSFLALFRNCSSDAFIGRQRDPWFITFAN